MLGQFRPILVLGAFLRIHVAFAEILDISSYNDDSCGLMVNGDNYDKINKGTDENLNKDTAKINSPTINHDM